MDAGKVAGLLVLLGVVGVLAAIVGSGIEAGPVKFPSIPGSRQKPLAVVSVAVIAGGITWWVVQQSHGGKGRVATGVVAAGNLRVLLVPRIGNAGAGATLSVSSEVDDSDGQLGTSQCVISWRDEVNKKLVRADTTACNATFTEPAAAGGVHRVTAKAEGTRGGIGTGSRSVDVTIGG